MDDDWSSKWHSLFLLIAKKIRIGFSVHSCMTSGITLYAFALSVWIGIGGYGPFLTV